MKIKVALVAFAVVASTAFAQIAMVNGASFQPGQGVAPGSIASIFGRNLCGVTRLADWVTAGQLPTTVGNCSVTINGVPAMLHFVSPGQINVIVPKGVAAGLVQVTVQNGTTVQTGTVTVSNAAPGIFVFSGMGIGSGAILHGTTFRPGPFSVTTDGEHTQVSLFVTGLDLTVKPKVTIGGVDAEVTFYGEAPGFVGLQQINAVIPAGAAGVGRVPVTVTSGDVTSNVAYIQILPTTAMMNGMPGWGPGMIVRENWARGHETAALAYNAAGNTVLVADEEDDSVRVISLDTGKTVKTIALPDKSDANAIAVNAGGTLAAVALSDKGAVALLDLAGAAEPVVIATGNYPADVLFTADRLLVTNAASGTLSIIDPVAKTVVGTVNTGFGASGLAATADRAIVANMQAGSVSIVNLTAATAETVQLPAGTRPLDVAVSTALNKTVITTPMSNSFVLLDIATRQFTTVNTGAQGMGPGAVAIFGNLAYIANQMSASVTVVDLSGPTVLRTFPVDPGPRWMALNAAGTQLYVLAEGTGTLDVVDTATGKILTRINATEGNRPGPWTLPVLTSVTPNTAAVGATVPVTLTGFNLQAVTGIQFYKMTGMMGGMGNSRTADTNIVVSAVTPSSDGTTLTATVQVLAAAEPGTRILKLVTAHGDVFGMGTIAAFTVTK